MIPKFGNAERTKLVYVRVQRTRSAECIVEVPENWNKQKIKQALLENRNKERNSLALDIVALDLIPEEFWNERLPKIKILENED